MQTGHALIAMLIAGAAIGLGIPLPGDETIDDDIGASGMSAVHGAAPKGQLEVLPAKSPSDAPQWSSEITLNRERDGHFYADVEVGGLPTRMLVDTGASVIALTGDDAAALGMSWHDAEIAVVAQGATGEVLGMRTVLPRVSLGGFEAENIDAVIVPEGLPISLLGQSFLSKVETVKITGDQMALSN